MPRKRSRQSIARTVALCYVRQSQTRDDTDTNSPNRQRENIRLVCEQHGWKPEWYEDVDGHKSGTKVKNRPGWLALKARMSDPDVAAMVERRWAEYGLGDLDMGEADPNLFGYDIR